MITSPCWKDALLSDQLNVNPLSVCNCSLVGLTLVVSAHLFALNEKLSTATTTSSVEADNLKKKNPAFTVSGATNSGNLNEAWCVAPSAEATNAVLIPLNPSYLAPK